MRERIIGGLVIFAIGFLSVAPSFGAIESRDILKTYFETGDGPTEQQFANLIDSYIHQTDDGFTLAGVGAVTSIKYPGGYDALRVGARTGVNEMLPYATLHLSDVIMASNWVDQDGYLPLLYQDSVGLPHYGYLSISGGSATGGFAPTGSPPVFPIFVQTWAWETEAGATITTAPEPASAMLLGACASGALLRRRR